MELYEELKKMPSVAKGAVFISYIVFYNLYLWHLKL